MPKYLPNHHKFRLKPIPGGYPILAGGEYPSLGQGEPHPVLAGGVPHPAWRYPSPGHGGYPILSWPGSMPCYPILTWMGGIHHGAPPDQDWGTPLARAGVLPWEGTWDQSLEYPLERTWDQ